MKINFRILQSEDIESYRQVRLACLKNHPDQFGTTYEEEANTNPLKFETILSTNNSHDFMFGAFDDKMLIGICGFIQQTRIKTSHLGEIVQMYVDPSYAGKGIGSQILKLAVDKAFENKKIDQVLLSVVYSNEKAVSTYKKLGFAEYGKLENYFKQGGGSWSQLFMALRRNKKHKIRNKKVQSLKIESLSL
ncbi:MAG: GNAT family protein [Ferruginibacter sp.]